MELPITSLGPQWIAENSFDVMTSGILSAIYDLALDSNDWAILSPSMPDVMKA